jgi:hypothetical protein
MSTKRTLETHLDVAAVAERCGGMSMRWVRNRIKAGDFEGFMLGNRIVVSSTSVNRYLERCRMPAQLKEEQPAA